MRFRRGSYLENLLMHWKVLIMRRNAGEIIGELFNRKKKTQTKNAWLVEGPVMDLNGMDFSCRFIWCHSNSRIRTGQGHCAVFMFKWRFEDSAKFFR